MMITEFWRCSTYKIAFQVSLPGRPDDAHEHVGVNFIDMNASLLVYGRLGDDREIVSVECSVRGDYSDRFQIGPFVVA